MIVNLTSNQLFLGGSLKRAVMTWLVEEAIGTGRLRKGETVAELSAGASALALAQVAREYGLRARLYIPEKLDGQAALRALGADLRLCPHDGMAAALQELRTEEAAGRVYWTRQNYSTSAALAVAAQLPVGLQADHLVCCVGSGNTLRGFARALRPARITAIYSSDLAGLRPSAVCLGEADRGALEGLRADWPQLEVREVRAGDLERARHELEEMGVEASLSTAAVLHVLGGLEGALGVSVDGAVVLSPCWP